MQTYAVAVRRNNAQHVVATTRDFSLTLGARRGDATAGCNPVEMLLSAYHGHGHSADRGAPRSAAPIGLGDLSMDGPDR
ncbi:hypothetical protein HIJ39_20205, partial [Sulfobacillus sp. DSM 109850]|nr:hypothetical protein [Sulfobacillus harzensis]